MAEPKEYTLVYTNTFERQLKRIEAKYYSLVRKTIENQLYRVEDAEAVILAIGEKEGSRLLVDGEEIES